MHFFLKSNIACCLCTLSLILYVNARVLNVTENGTITLIISPTLLSTGKPILAQKDGLLSSTGTRSKLVPLNGTHEPVKDELNELLTGIRDSHYDYLRELALLNETENEISRVKRVADEKSLKEVKAVVFEDMTGKDFKTKELNERLLGYPIPKHVLPQVPVQTSDSATVTKPSNSGDSGLTSNKPDSQSTGSENNMGTTGIETTTAAGDRVKNVSQTLVGEQVLESAPPTSPDNVSSLVIVEENSIKQFGGSKNATSKTTKLITKPTVESSKSTLKDLPTSMSTAAEDISLTESSGKIEATSVENSSIKSEIVTAANLESKLSSVHSTVEPASSQSEQEKITTVPIVSNVELRPTENTSLKSSSAPPSSSVDTTKEQSTTKSLPVTIKINETAVKTSEPSTSEKPVNSTIDIGQNKNTVFKQVKNGNVSKTEDFSTTQPAINDVANSSNFDVFDEMLEQLSLLETEAMRKLQELELTLMNLTVGDHLLTTDHNESSLNDESLTNFVEYYLALGGGSNETRGEVLVITTEDYVIPNNVTQFISDIVLNVAVEDDKIAAVATQSYQSGGENVSQTINSTTTEGIISSTPTTQLDSSTIAADVTETETENPTTISTTKKRGTARRKRKHRNRISRTKRGTGILHMETEKNRLNFAKNNSAAPSLRISKPVKTTAELRTHESDTRNTSKTSQLSRETLRNNHNDDLKLKMDNSTMAFVIDADDLTVNVKVKIENKNASETGGSVKPNLRLLSLVLDEKNASEVVLNVVPTEGQTAKAQRGNVAKKEISEGENQRLGDYADSEKYPWHFGPERRSPFYDLLVSEANRESPSYSDEDEDGDSWAEWSMFPQRSGDGGDATEQRRESSGAWYLAGRVPQAMAVKEGAKEVARKVTDKDAELREKSKGDGDFLFAPTMTSDSETQEEIDTLRRLIDGLLVDDLDDYTKIERQQEEVEREEVDGTIDQRLDKDKDDDDDDDEAEHVTENRGPPIDDVIVPSTGYLWTVTLPAFLGMLAVVIFCCLCLHTKCFCCKLFEEHKTSSLRPPTDSPVRRQQYPSTARGGHSMA